VNTCTYLDEPGIFCDMLDALKLRFNGERVYLSFRGISIDYEENERFYQLIIDRLSDVSEKLLPLFYLDNDKQIQSAISVYIQDYIDLVSDNLFDSFYSSFRDVERLKRTVFQTYISPDCPETFDISTVVSLKEKIFDADLPSDVKMYLMNFLLFGENEIDSIVSEIRKAESLCRDLHKLHADEKKNAILLYKEDCIKKLSQKHLTDISVYENIYFTIELVIKDVVGYKKYNNKTWLSALGLTAAKKVSVNSSFVVNLYELGRILYDETRLRILDMLLKEEMYCAQIAKVLGLKNNSTLYHLNMMECEGLLAQRRERKKVYYYINPSYLVEIKNLIDSKITGGKNNEPEEDYVE